MKSKGQLLNLVVIGMTLGTAWAVRGHFGHEQGAAWAGAIGAMAILYVAKRPDWNAKFFKASMAAAIGWGLGGIMSYGIVVGYGRGTEFFNVYYGLVMLFVIGGLYGFIGGGLFGLVLEESESKKVNWLLLTPGMVAGAAIAYFFLIIEWEWLMTPPRSEMWAACLGAALFLTWFLRHFQFQSALRIAAFSALGGGFGFAFGNFLQLMGNVTGIHFNWWNVMEYSLGFFGGIGMAYGTFSSNPSTLSTPSNLSNFSNFSNPSNPSNFSPPLPLLFLTLFIPYVVWNQTFTIEKLTDRYEAFISGDISGLVYGVFVLTLILVLLYTLFTWYRFYHQKIDRDSLSERDVQMIFFLHFGLYIVFSLIGTGAFIDFGKIEQYLYIVNFLVIIMITRRLDPIFIENTDKEKWGRYLLIVLVVLAALALVAIATHGELQGAHRRFKF